MDGLIRYNSLIAIFAKIWLLWAFIFVPQLIEPLKIHPHTPHQTVIKLTRGLEDKRANNLSVAQPIFPGLRRVTQSISFNFGSK